MNLPIVFVHGIRVSGAMWAPHRDLLSPTPIRTPDLPGHGTRRGEPFTLAGAIRTVVDAIDEVGGRALVVGHSLGGYAAIAAAARHPHKVAGLVASGATTVPGRVLTSAFFLAHKALSRLRDGGDAVSRAQFRGLLPPAVAEPVIAAGIATEVIPSVLAQAARFDPLTDLASYPGPVWLVNGAHDHFRAGERRFVRVCWDGRLIVVPRAGHYLPMVRAAEFSRIVRDCAAVAAGPAPGVRSEEAS
ncbi:alpha/beta fold hydrolase [Labedaea rhizosphaerae]|uniref:Pimeloyl-ACP methyl ester carboxylesterase n=1 Tax=Labedaea rhizosphaerae TaxID=598644 RepID=A0A4R6SB76_LABRH|nr:alpha/beta hydrolase [Labedaea rhizosphaerae]TDP97190.1 pimeloyl-ACP methyl ester carboxylesterase [Labedaea rhizosphaerae]